MEQWTKIKKNHISDHFKIRNKNWSSVFTKKSLKMYQGRWMFFNLTEIWVLKNILIWYCILKFSGESCSTIMSVWNPVFRTEDNGVERRLPHYDCWRFWHSRYTTEGYKNFIGNSRRYNCKIVLKRQFTYITVLSLLIPADPADARSDQKSIHIYGIHNTK